MRKDGWNEKTKKSKKQKIEKCFTTFFSTNIL